MIDANRDATRPSHAPADHPKVPRARTGVLLANLGTPDDYSYWPMRRYLNEFLSDRRVVDYAPWKWQPLLQLIILTKRPFTSGANYKSIWNHDKGESPLMTITKDQTAKIAARMKARYGDSVIVDFSMRYGNPSTKSKVQALVEAGGDGFLLHVDSGQAHVHGDIDAARHALMDLLDARQVWYGLSLTLYEGEEHDLPRIMRDCARHPFFDGALVTLALDFEHAFDPPQDRLREPQMAQVASAMQAKLDVLPAAYLPSNLDRDEVCWLMWFYWINVETGRTAALSPALNRLTKSAWRRTHDTEFFGQTLGAGQRKPGHTARLLVATALAEGALHPGRVGHFAQVGKRGDRGRNLRFHYVVVQQAPRVDPDSGRLQICWQCPDATIRNGLLTPVCIAGRINPMGGRPATAPRALVEEVFAHLGEAPPPQPAPPESAAPPSAAS